MGVGSEPEQKEQAGAGRVCRFRRKQNAQKRDNGEVSEAGKAGSWKGGFGKKHRHDLRLIQQPST